MPALTAPWATRRSSWPTVGRRPLADLRPRRPRSTGRCAEGRTGATSTTEVLDHWSTVKPAYRVTLEDGTELIASGDHRFLTDRGWKHVTGAEQGRARRPHLTLNDKLMGIGRVRRAAARTRRLPAGLSVRDDPRRRDSSASYEYGAERTTGDVHRFRLALIDFEALQRARDVPRGRSASRPTSSSSRRPPARDRRSTRSGRRARDVSTRIQRADRAGRASPSDDWCKGFLAGIFDAEGSCSGGVLRIANTDPTIIDWTTLTACGDSASTSVVEPTRRRRTGSRTCASAAASRAACASSTLSTRRSRRKRDDRGPRAQVATRDLGVVAIEPLGVELPMYDITTGTGDFIANGVVSHNCFARPTHNYLDFDAGRDFEREIVVKVNVPEVLRAELARPSWKGEHVAMGTNTDPYQWVEGRYKLMPGIWEAMRDFAQPVLGADQVAAAAARPRRCCRRSPRSPESARTSRSRRSTRRRGARPSRTRRTRGRGSRRSPSSTAPASRPAS